MGGGAALKAKTKRERDYSRVNIGLNPPPKIASKCFIVLSASAGHGEFQKRSLQKSDPGKGVNVHIFKIVANETNNVQPTVYG